MRNLVVVALLGAFAAFGVSRTALALPKFKKAFEEKYVDESKNKDFAEAVKKESCNVCHVKGEKKDVRNAYGKVLAELIPGDAQARIKEAADKEAEEAKVLKELEAALVKAEGMKVDPKNANSETFGDRIKAGKLPAGN